MKNSASVNYPATPLIQGASSLKKARLNQQANKVETSSQPFQSHKDQEGAQSNEAASHPNRPTYALKKEKAMAYSLRELHLAKNLEASAIKNLELALEAKDFIRDNFYNKDKGSFKSSNKVKLNNDPDLESTRLAHANDEVVEWSNGAQLKLARDQFWTAKGHNCDGLALMAHDWLAQTKSADVCMVEMGSRHIATVVGKLPDQSLPKDMTKWPADLSICDPWLNVACLAKDYPARFKEKMQKWSKDEKRIRVNDDWLLPNEPAWMSVINDKKTLWHPDNSIDPNLKEPRRECN